VTTRALEPESGPVNQATPDSPCMGSLVCTWPQSFSPTWTCRHSAPAAVAGLVDVTLALTRTGSCPTDSEATEDDRSVVNPDAR
jgi:hypothetical protein